VELTRHVRTLGIHTLTFWGLSTENWRHRPAAELNFLIDLFSKSIDRYIEDAQKEGVRFIHLGNKTRLPKKFLNKLARAEEETKQNQNCVLNLALDYGGHDELIRATRKIIDDAKAGELDPAKLADPVGENNTKVPATVYSEYLDTAGQPHPFPDFIIRTSGEVRLSGLMPWQAVYAELYFEPSLFPDFTTDKLDAAIDEYYKRQRRYGGGH
jgi:undecaprenyl diphosphate synthase